MESSGNVTLFWSKARPLVHGYNPDHGLCYDYEKAFCLSKTIYSWHIEVLGHCFIIIITLAKLFPEMDSAIIKGSLRSCLWKKSFLLFFFFFSSSGQLGSLPHSPFSSVDYLFLQLRWFALPNNIVVVHK